MLDNWSDHVAYLASEAERDLTACCDQVHSCLVVFRGEDPLLLAWVRPFDKGAYHKPLIELSTLAAALSADRLALSMGGRAWSLEDPVPPVVDGVGDMRQRTLVIESVDGAGRGEPSRSSVIMPFDRLDGDGVRWGETLHLDGAEGWISSLLLGTVRIRGQLRASRSDIRGQLDRCLLLGHEIAVHDTVARTLGLDRAAP